MKIRVYPDKEALGEAAAKAGAEKIRNALAERDRAFIVLATGASQFELLESLVAQPKIHWSRVEAFHLDEYIGLEENHPASFCRYLKERFEKKLPCPLSAFHYIQGDTDPEKEIQRLNALVSSVEMDLAFVGIGENGHLAFNDPPADFETKAPYLWVLLDEACRRQQLGEGWFSSLEAVPKKAISMSIQEILRVKSLICTVPEARKAKAVQKALEGPVTSSHPSSVLQTHPDCMMLLDTDAASLLRKVE